MIIKENRNQKYKRNIKIGQEFFSFKRLSLFLYLKILVSLYYSLNVFKFCHINYDIYCFQN